MRQVSAGQPLHNGNGRLQPPHPNTHPPTAHQLVHVEAAGGHGDGAARGAGALVGAAQLGGHHPLLRALQVQQAWGGGGGRWGGEGERKEQLTEVKSSLAGQLVRAGKDRVKRELCPRALPTPPSPSPCRRAPVTTAHSLTVPMAFSNSTYRMEYTQPCGIGGAEDNSQLEP